MNIRTSPTSEHRTLDTISIGVTFTVESALVTVVMMRVYSSSGQIAGVYLSGSHAGTVWVNMPPTTLVKVRTFEMVEVSK